jgi:hypothetical protein
MFENFGKLEILDGMDKNGEEVDEVIKLSKTLIKGT